MAKISALLVHVEIKTEIIDYITNWSFA